MRKYFIPVAAIALLAPACKKETIEVKETKTITSNAAKPNCWGNFWQTDNFFYGHPGNSTFNIPFSLVYNNKLYLFDASQDLVRIYNGISWTNIRSSVPFASFDPPNFGFTIGAKGYAGNIDMNSVTHPFWEYDFAANTWAQKTNFPGERRAHASAGTFSIGTKGYLVSGLGELNNNALTLTDTWEYDPATDSWDQKADLPLAGRAAYASGFSINNKGYMVAGKYITENTTTHLKSLYEYDPVSDSWASKTQFPGLARYHPSVFVISGAVYAGCGRTQNTFFKISINIVRLIIHGRRWPMYWLPIHLFLVSPSTQKVMLNLLIRLQIPTSCLNTRLKAAISRQRQIKAKL